FYIVDARSFGRGTPCTRRIESPEIGTRPARADEEPSERLKRFRRRQRPAALRRQPGRCPTTARTNVPPRRAAQWAIWRGWRVVSRRPAAMAPTAGRSREIAEAGAERRAA